MIFPVESHFYAQGLCVSFPYQFVALAYVFPSIFWGLVQVSLTHRLGDCIFFPGVVFVSFPGDFVVQDELLFSPCRELCLLIRFETV